MTMSMATTSGATPLEFEVGSPLFYVVVGVGSILALLITCIVTLCLCIGCVCLRRNRASKYMCYHCNISNYFTGRYYCIYDHNNL